MRTKQWWMGVALVGALLVAQPAAAQDAERQFNVFAQICLTPGPSFDAGAAAAARAGFRATSDAGAREVLGDRRPIERARGFEVTGGFALLSVQREGRARTYQCQIVFSPPRAANLRAPVVARFGEPNLREGDHEVWTLDEPYGYTMISILRDAKLSAWKIIEIVG